MSKRQMLCSPASGLVALSLVFPGQKPFFHNLALNLSHEGWERGAQMPNSVAEKCQKVAVG